jgi:DNA-directed RNA polymerase specialized sigma24 family protein
MARDPLIEARLQRWAEWVQVGDGSGYPCRSVLHEDWLPPSQGITPVPKLLRAGNDGPQTHRALGKLSSATLRNTVVVHYVHRWPLQQQAEYLGCAVDTVHDRVERVHRELRGLLGQA